MPNESAKRLIRSWLGGANLERAQAAYEFYRKFRSTFGRRTGSPIPVAEIQSTLKTMGIRRGNILHIHSSLSHLSTGGETSSGRRPTNVLRYAQDVVEMLLELVGPEGTVLMNTDSVNDVLRHELEGQVFDYASSRTRRGMIAQLFMQRDDVIRSVHPWYNVTGWGKRAAELIEDHVQSTPYTMDRHSPWYKLTEAGGKIILLGCGFEANSSLHLIDYLYPEEFPRAIFLNKPFGLKYMNRDRCVATMNTMIHCQQWRNGQEERFANYLQGKYGLYQQKRYPGAVVVVYNAKDQYEAMLKEMRNNVTWYDPAFRQGK